MEAWRIDHAESRIAEDNILVAKLSETKAGITISKKQGSFE